MPDLEAPGRALEAREREPQAERDAGYGYGVGVFTLDDVPVVAHSGQQSKAATYLLLCPELDLGVRVLSNTSNLPARSLAWRIFRTVRDS